MDRLEEIDLAFETWWRDKDYDAFGFASSKGVARSAWHRSAEKSLSHEAVRDEALENMEHGFEAWWSANGWETHSAHSKAVARTVWHAALKREPNAAAEPDFQMGDPHPCDMTPAEREKLFAAGPAPAAPDVESMVRRINAQFDECCTFGGHWDRMRDVALEAAALSRLGHGWVPVREGLPKGVALWLQDNGSMYVGEWLEPPHKSNTHWTFLPPPPERP